MIFFYKQVCSGTEQSMGLMSILLDKHYYGPNQITKISKCFLWQIGDAERRKLD